MKSENSKDILKYSTICFFETFYVQTIYIYILYGIWLLLKLFLRIIVFVKSASFRSELVGKIISPLKPRVFNNDPVAS